MYRRWVGEGSEVGGGEGDGWERVEWRGGGRGVIGMDGVGAMHEVWEGLAEAKVL